MSGESLPSGVLADELRAWLEFTTKTGVRLPCRPFQLVVEDVLAALASPSLATGALSEQKIDAIVLLAEKMMRDSWATGDDSAWHPARDELRAALASPEGRPR